MSRLANLASRILHAGKPSALEMATRQLETARCDLLEACSRREEWAAIELMYRGRISRLELDVSALARRNTKETGNEV